MAPRAGALHATPLVRSQRPPRSPSTGGVALERASWRWQPGAKIRIWSAELDGFLASLPSYRYYRPAIEAMPWRSRELTVQDPFGNRQTFYIELE